MAGGVRYRLQSVRLEVLWISLILCGPFIGEESWGWLRKSSEKAFYVVYGLGEVASNSPKTHLKGELRGDVGSVKD